MVMNISQNAKSPRSKKEVEMEQKKAGKKRAMQESESEEEDDEDEVDLETLKNISKKMKQSAADDSEDEELDDDDEEDDEEDDDEEDDDEEDDEEDDDDEEADSEEEKKPVKPQQKAQPAKQQLAKPQQQLKTNGVPAPQKQKTIEVNGNAVIITNLDRQARGESLMKFILDKSGVQSANCFVSMKPSAIITTQNKQDAEKIMKACQSVFFLGSQMQVSTLANGMVSEGRPCFGSKNVEEIEPSKTCLVYSLTKEVPFNEVKKLCPKAIDCNQSKKGVFLSFASAEDCQETFLELAGKPTIGGVTCMVKYVKNNFLNPVHTGKETRLMLFNLGHEMTKQSVQQLAPKATFVHFNPCAGGSWIVEFANVKDCKEAGDRLLNYQNEGRAVRLSFATSENWDIRFNARAHLSDAQMHFTKQFPDMSDFHVMSHAYKNQRAPAFMVTFKTREQWLRALDKAVNLRSISGVQLSMPNIGQPKSEKAAPPAGNKMQPKLTAKKVKDEEDDSEEEKPAGKPQFQKSSPGKGGNNFRGRGGAKFGGQQRGGGGGRGGRGGNFRGGRGGNFQQRGRGGNFRGRGGK